jgi:hypothetical protein
LSGIVYSRAATARIESGNGQASIATQTGVQLLRRSFGTHMLKITALMWRTADLFGRRPDHAGNANVEIDGADQPSVL